MSRAATRGQTWMESQQSHVSRVSIETLMKFKITSLISQNGF